MHKLEQCLSLLLLLSLTTMLLGGDIGVNQQPISEAEAIKLAENAALQLLSPPSIYTDAPESVALWPNMQGSVMTTYFAPWHGGSQLPQFVSANHQDMSVGSVYSSPMIAMTLTTVLTYNTAQDVDVAFSSVYRDINNNNTLYHLWLFKVTADKRAIFVREEGDALPSTGGFQESNSFSRTIGLYLASQNY